MPCLTCGRPNGGAGYCPEHAHLDKRWGVQAGRGRDRGTTAQRGYDNAWRTLRAQILEQQGRICAYCGAHATTVDHIVPISRAPELRLEPSNLVPCCVRCNTARSNQHTA